MSEKCPNCGLFELEKPADGHKSYLICPSCRAIKLTYVPQDYQEPFHRTDYQYIYNPRTGKYDIRIQKIGVFGGFGSGKSRATLHEILIRALENPNGTGLLTAPTLPQLKKTTLKIFFNEVCPPPLIKYYNKTDGEIRLINGFTFYIIPSDEEEKLRSINAGLIHIEEASGIKRSIYDQLLTRMRDDNVKNKVIIVCSNPDLGWIKEVFVDNKDRQDPYHPEHDKYDPSITVYIWPTHLNKYLPADFIESISRGKPEWWIKRYLKGSFEHSEGMVYPNFSSTLVTEEEYLKKFNLTKIPDSWDKFVTLDHGLRNPTAVYFHAINPITWEVVTYDEYYVPGKTIPEHAKALKPKIELIPYGKLLFMVADPSIRNKTDPVNGKSVLGLYEEYGLFFSPGNNDVEAGILRVNSYIERGKWKIFKDKCPNLVREGLNYKFPEVTMDDADENLDERPVKANDHAMDSCRYGFMRLPDDPDLLKTVAYEPPKSYSGTQYREYEPPDEEDEEFDYERDWTSYV